MLLGLVGSCQYGDAGHKWSCTGTVSLLASIPVAYQCCVSVSVLTVCVIVWQLQQEPEVPAIDFDGASRAWDEVHEKGVRQTNKSLLRKNSQFQNQQQPARVRRHLHCTSQLALPPVAVFLQCWICRCLFTILDLPLVLCCLVVSNRHQIAHTIQCCTNR
jgi:hypothetical protein